MLDWLGHELPQIPSYHLCTRCPRSRTTAKDEDEDEDEDEI